jgi:uncharacterized protein with PQ loop repeat
MILLALSPTTLSSGEKKKFLAEKEPVPKRLEKYEATGARENFSSGPFLGLPKCEQSITFAPPSASLLIVGSAAWILLSLVILPSLIGTLKSHRTRTLRPFTFKSFTSFLDNLLIDSLFLFLFYLLLLLFYHFFNRISSAFYQKLKFYLLSRDVSGR